LISIDKPDRPVPSEDPAFAPFLAPSRVTLRHQRDKYTTRLLLLALYEGVNLFYATPLIVQAVLMVAIGWYTRSLYDIRALCKRRKRYTEGVEMPVLRRVK